MSEINNNQNSDKLIFTSIQMYKMAAEIECSDIFRRKLYWKSFVEVKETTSPLTCNQTKCPRETPSARREQYHTTDNSDVV